MMQVGFQHYRMGTTLGTASSQGLQISGSVQSKTLLNTGMTVYFGKDVFQLPGYDVSKNVMYEPDVVWEISKEDRLSDKDVLLEKTLRYIEGMDK